MSATESIVDRVKLNKKTGRWEVILTANDIPSQFQVNNINAFLANLRKGVMNAPCTILGKIEIQINESSVPEEILKSNIRSLVVPSDIPDDVEFKLAVRTKTKARDVTSSHFKGEYADTLQKGVKLTVLAPGKRLRLIATPVTGTAKTHSTDYRPVTVCAFSPLGEGRYIFWYEPRPGYPNPKQILRDAVESLNE